MKKLFIMSLLAAVGLGVQAAGTVAYVARVTNIEDDGLKVPGTLPGVVALRLIDSAYKPDTPIYSYDFNFAGMTVEFDEVSITLGTDNYIGADGRLDIARMVNENGTGYTDLGGGAELTFEKAEQFHGVNIALNVELDYDEVYEGFKASGKTSEDDQMKYVNKNLKTIFKVAGKDYQLDCDAPKTVLTVKSSAKLSMLSPVEPVPEPTSGLLLLMGLAGLALKRKRAA